MFIGDGAVGKTSLISQFDTRKFNKNHIRTVGLDAVKVAYTQKDDNVELEVKLWDTAGQDRFKTMTYQFYKNADAVIIAFDLTVPETFAGVTNWLQSIFKHKSEEIPKVLCGNKSDLVAVADNAVNSEEAKKMAAEYKMKYFETSAFTGENVEAMIHSTIEEAYITKIKPIIEQEKKGIVQAEPIQLGKPSEKPQQKKEGCC